MYILLRRRNCMYLCTLRKSCQIVYIKFVIFSIECAVIGVFALKKYYATLMFFFIIGKREPVDPSRCIYACDSCGKAFTTKFNLKRHINMHCSRSREAGVPIQGENNNIFVNCLFTSFVKIFVYLLL